ncbi:hypothetical protein QFZ48_002634 [Chitinophaga sp. W2I13]|uniref:hypothetical protein n=1 Tax=Chitinophaga sp. W2I13 TaxID=3373923 RepID=UPI003D2578AA
MKTTDDTRSIFDDDPLLAEKKKFYPTLGHAWLIPVYSLVIFLAFYIAAAGAYPGITNDKVLSSLITIPIYCSLLLVVPIYSYNRKKKVEPDYRLFFPDVVVDIYENGQPRQYPLHAGIMRPHTRPAGIYPAGSI